LEDFLQDLGIRFKDPDEVKEMSPLVLAYIGDAVYDVYIRTYIIHRFKGKVNDYHKFAINFVKASSQSLIIHRIMDTLSEEEKRIVLRGRNQKSFTVPKNAILADYKYATGFETLIGYLYLTNRRERMVEIIKKAISIIDKEVVGDKVE